MAERKHYNGETRIGENRCFEAAPKSPCQEEEVLLITLGRHSDKSLMSLLSERKHSYLASEDPSILDKVAKMGCCFNKIFIEVDYTFTQKALEHPVTKDSTVMICSGADQDFNSSEFFSERYKIQPVNPHSFRSMLQPTFCVKLFSR